MPASQPAAKGSQEPEGPCAEPVVDRRMRSYYDRRAGEYDEWWLGSGGFVTRHREGWHEEVAEVMKLLAALPPWRVLDVACGTGFITRQLRGEVVGLDQSAAMVRAARRHAPGARILRGEAVPLPFADGTFDAIFTSHFYGHLQADERIRFIAEARRVADRLIVLDAALREDVRDVQWQQRELNDGSRHRVYKRYFTPQQLAAELDGVVLHAGRWFVLAGTEPIGAGKAQLR